MGAICTVEHVTQFGKGTSVAITPSVKINRDMSRVREVYCENDEWQAQDEVPGVPHVPFVEDSVYTVKVQPVKPEDALTHPALLRPRKEEGMLTKYSIRSSEYMGPIDSSESTM